MSLLMSVAMRISGLFCRCFKVNCERRVLAWIWKTTDYGRRVSSLQRFLKFAGADWQLRALPSDVFAAVRGLWRGTVRMSCPLSLPSDSIVLREPPGVLSSSSLSSSSCSFFHIFHVLLSSAKCHLLRVFDACRGVRPWHSVEPCVCPAAGLIALTCGSVAVLGQRCWSLICIVLRSDTKMSDEN